jgi:glycosyltransferase involved in cell wall biosynthesis
MKSVSCIIPVYGLGKNDNMKYFEQLLRSLSAASEYLHDGFEIIVVNDDVENISKDGIVLLFEKCGLLECLKYVANETNRGQAYSRNVGAKIAVNEYLHFIDQDDYISSDFYLSLVKEESISDLYITRPFFFKQDNNKVVKAYSPILEYLYKKSRKLSELWILLIINIAYSPGQTLVSRKAFNEAGGFPILKNKGSDDYGLFYNFVFCGDYSLSYLRNSVFYYRTHSSQSSRNCDMNASVSEFLSMVTPSNLRTRLIHCLKKKKYLSYLVKLFYVIVYKRA